MKDPNNNASSNTGRIILIVGAAIGAVCLLVFGCCVCGPLATALLFEPDRTTTNVPQGTPPAPIVAKDDKPEPRDPKLDEFVEVVKVTGHNAPIAEVAAREVADEWKLTITVDESWNSMTYQNRLKHAKMFRGAWKGVVAPDASTISIRDARGTEIGASGAYSESAIWVED